MRKPFVALAVAGTLSLAAVPVLHAQVFPPVRPLPAPPVAAPVEPAPTRVLDQHPEPREVTSLRKLLADRGFGPSVAEGPMLYQGSDGASNFDYVVDAEADPLIGHDPAGAWLVWTAAGRWYVWDYGAAAPADARAVSYEHLAREQARAEGRLNVD
jgi:hypothetical protein